MEDETLGKYFENGKPLPTMKAFFDESVDGSPSKLLATKYLGHCATISAPTTDSKAQIYGPEALQPTSHAIRLRKCGKENDWRRL